ncbi:MAG TPA: HAMP domain-containing sensor histidine kinase [Vicinamibacterales bacterium]
MIITDFGDLIGARMQSEYRTLAARWFERLLDLVPVDAREVFPTESLLDHVPALIVEISHYLRQPEGEAIASNTAILEKATELGALRYTQRASLHQVLREYHLLGGVLLSFVIEELRASGVSTSAVEAVELVSRLHQAVDVLSQATVEAFVGLYTRTIAEQSERLDQLTRMAAHEWRQPLGVLQFGVGVLRRPDVNPQVIDRTLASVERSVQHLVDLTRKLETMARVRSDGDNAVVQTVSVTTIAQEAARQLREMSDARDVTLSVAEDMPTVTVDVGRLELAFVNLLSNAIKYSDPDKDERRVEVVGAVADDGSARIEVRDNGIGIPDAALTTIFERFTRAHANQADLLHIGGIGLGLSIVSDCVRAMRGSIEVRSVERQGTTFIVTLPSAESAPVIN